MICEKLANRQPLPVLFFSRIFYFSGPVSDALEMDNALNLLYLSDVTDLKVLDFLSTKQIEALWQLVEHVKTNPAFRRALDRSTKRGVNHFL